MDKLIVGVNRIIKNEKQILKSKASKKEKHEAKYIINYLEYKYIFGLNKED